MRKYIADCINTFNFRKFYSGVIIEEKDSRLEELAGRVKKYPFARYAYRIRYESQVIEFLGNPKSLKPKTNVYYGKVNGIDVAIYFSVAGRTSPSIHARTQEDFDKISRIYDTKFTALRR